ncbi:MAG: MOSC domain-containing protein [Chloroflexi bacterium]|nr:MOSC domain-containing protein [Chloroflexota bacterium]
MQVSAIVVSQLHMYPVKSCAGTPLEVACLDARGVVHDREFMVVDAAGDFLTQREAPRLALIVPSRSDDRLELGAPGMPPFRLAPVTVGEATPVRVWRDHVAAVDQGELIAEWLGDFLRLSCRLVRQADNAIRHVDPEYATKPDDQVGFADGYPLLLLSEESLADLNRRLTEPLPMNRFRPNVVVRGSGEPYAEDCWSRIRIGEVECSVVKACARCVTTTTDQLTAERKAEPLVTLATYRRVPRGVLFGQNLIHHAPGVLRVGNTVHVLARRRNVAATNGG